MQKYVILPRTYRVVSLKQLLLQLVSKNEVKMDWLSNLFVGGGIAHSVLVLALTIAIGTALGKVKVAGISLGITWILFVGIYAGQ
jgi:hypothetical protein